MGFLKNGQWVDQWYNTKKTDGRFVRQDPQFRNWITSLRTEGIDLAGLDTSIYGLMLILFIIFLPKGVLGELIDRLAGGRQKDTS